MSWTEELNPLDHEGSEDCSTGSDRYGNPVDDGVGARGTASTVTSVRTKIISHIDEEGDRYK